MSNYARHEHHDFMAVAGQALADPPLQAALVRLTSTLMAGNRRGYAALPDSDKLRDHAKRIKEHTLAHLDKYLEQLEVSVQRNGGHVHWATTAEDARQIVLQIAKHSGPPDAPTDTLDVAYDDAGTKMKPDEMAAALEFLLSDAASYIVGTLMVADGGFLLRPHPNT